MRRRPLSPVEKTHLRSWGEDLGLLLEISGLLGAKDYRGTLAQDRALVVTFGLLEMPAWWTERQSDSCLRPRRSSTGSGVFMVPAYYYPDTRLLGYDLNTQAFYIKVTVRGHSQQSTSTPGRPVDLPLQFKLTNLITTPPLTLHCGPLRYIESYPLDVFSNRILSLDYLVLFPNYFSSPIPLQLYSPYSPANIVSFSSHLKWIFPF